MSFANSVVNLSMLETRLFINNEFVQAESGRTFTTVDPSTEEAICNVEEADVADVDKAVAAAKAAFQEGSPWRTMDASQRGNLIRKLADLIERDAEYLTELEALDRGTTMGLEGQYGCKADVGAIVKIYRYYAGWADKIHGKTIPIDGNTLCYTRKEPIGVCAAIIPWNFPLIMQCWKIAPALATGCTMVLKSSEKTPLTALHVSQLVKEAGVPPGVINTLSGYGPTVGAALAKHMDVDKITFTGSTSVGFQIEQMAAASNLKRVTLELGGKSPCIVCDDADLDSAVFWAHIGLFLNQGQCCTAGSRVFVQESIYDEFVEKAVAKAQAVKVGPYYEPNVEQGPQIDDLQFQKVLDYIDIGKKGGANLATGGKRHGNKGYYIQPTIFTDVTDDMKIAKEEIFGPVMSVLKFKTDDEVVKRANATPYGLAAGIMSQNIGRAIGLANRIRAGSVWINSYDDFAAQAPFGGFKLSGHGREKGEEALDNYLETKCVFIPVQGPKT